MLSPGTLCYEVITVCILAAMQCFIAEKSFGNQKKVWGDVGYQEQVEANYTRHMLLRT